jgi:FkbM family methyltransferase
MLMALAEKLARHIRRRAPERVYHGLFDVDRKLEAYLSYDGGFYVELGANDGVEQSNTLYFERKRGWRGVLVEPIPHQYLACKRNRGVRNTVFCNACVSFEYADKFVEIAYSNLMSSALGLETDIGDPVAHANIGKRFLDPSVDVFHFGALAKPLNTILHEAQAPSFIDLLSLDVEGAEIEVLKGLNFEQFSFGYMCIESRAPERIKVFLAPFGYEFVEQLSPNDFLFKGPVPRTAEMSAADERA